MANDFPQVVGFVAIAYPFSVLWALTLFNSESFLSKAKISKPKLFIVGTRDNFTALDKFKKYVDDFPDPKKLEVIRDADHFFYSIEDDVARKVEAWVSDVVMLDKFTSK